MDPSDCASSRQYMGFLDEIQRYPVIHTGYKMRMDYFFRPGVLLNIRGSYMEKCIPGAYRNCVLSYWEIIDFSVVNEISVETSFYVLI